MDVQFLSGNPRTKFRRVLDRILCNGVDQVAIACAYCTAAGVKLLLPHFKNLANVDSFLIVSATPPTDYVALGQLFAKIPRNLFVHWGALAPVEKKAGAALMHSKVFYARSGDECWLLTGSINLTGNATQGGNCEAGVLLHGAATEKPFVDAITHLYACRAEATEYDPTTIPTGIVQTADTVVIHAESASLPLHEPLPIKVHLSLNSSQFDSLLVTPADVRLFVYPRGALGYGWQRAVPAAAYAGQLTGQNLTARNPIVKGAGASAEWSDASLEIVESHGLLRLGKIAPLGAGVTTQAFITLNAESDPSESLFSDRIKFDFEPIAGESRPADIDPDMMQFFSRTKGGSEGLEHVPSLGRRQVINAPTDELRERDLERIRSHVMGDREVLFKPREHAKRRDRHPFIVRAKYRLRDRS